MASAMPLGPVTQAALAAEGRPFIASSLANATSGAKARILKFTLSARLKPRPFKAAGFMKELSTRDTNAYKTNSAAARRSAPAAAYARIACATVQSAKPSYSAGREQCPDPPPREHSPDLHPESPPSAPRKVFPPAPSAAAPDLPAAETCRCHCARWPRPSHATKLLLPAPALQSQTPRAPAASPFQAARHSPAKTPQFASLQIRGRAEPSLRRPHRPPLPSYLPPPPARSASSTPGCSPSSISKDADRTCQTRHPPREARPPKARPHFSKSQSKPNRASKAADECPVAANSVLRFPGSNGRNFPRRV